MKAPLCSATISMHADDYFNQAVISCWGVAIAILNVMVIVVVCRSFTESPTVGSLSDISNEPDKVCIIIHNIMISSYMYTIVPVMAGKCNADYHSHPLVSSSI